MVLPVHQTNGYRCPGVSGPSTAGADNDCGRDSVRENPSLRRRPADHQRTRPSPAKGVRIPNHAALVRFRPPADRVALEAAENTIFANMLLVYSASLQPEVFSRARCEQVTMPNQQQTKTCFVISPIGDPTTDIRKRADQILDHVITPALAGLGYDITRADKIAEPGMISSQVIQHVLNDHLVIADLTGHNPNVFYELALRHAARKPLVQLIQLGEKIPFDVANMRTILIDHRDLDSVATAKIAIREQVSTMENSTNAIETPIVAALQLQSLRASDKPEDRSLADVLFALSDIRSQITALDEKIEANLEMAAATARRSSVNAFGHVYRTKFDSILSALQAYKDTLPTTTADDTLSNLQNLQSYLASESAPAVRRDATPPARRTTS